MSRATFSFKTKDERQESQTGGEYIRISEGSGPVEIWVDGRVLGAFKSGRTVKPGRFKSFALVNQVDGVNQVIVSVGMGDLDVEDVEVTGIGKVTVTEIERPVEVAGEIVLQKVSSALVVQQDRSIAAGATEKLLDAADTNRAVQIQVESSSIEPIMCRFGGADVAVNRGLKIVTGKGILGSGGIETSSEIRFHNPGGSAVTVTVAEVPK